MDSSTLRSPLEVLNPHKPVCVKSSAPVHEAIQKMKNEHIGCVCVVEDQSLVGIFTERDVLTKIVGSGVDLSKTIVADVMTPDPEYLFEDDEIAFALNRMQVGGFRHVPLVDLKGKPQGVVSVRDILRYLLKNIGATS